MNTTASLYRKYTDRLTRGGLFSHTKMNLKIRLQSKTFWVGLISALFVTLSQVLPLFGITIDLGGYEDAVMSVLSILTVLGVITDPTTPGVGDSDTTLAKDDITQTAGDVVGMD